MIDDTDLLFYSKPIALVTMMTLRRMVPFLLFMTNGLMVLPTVGCNSGYDCDYVNKRDYP